MATCKDCLHLEACCGFLPSDLDKDVWDLCREGRADEIPDIEERCSNFKDRSRIVELPCKIGQTVYEVVYFRNGTAGHIIPLKVVGIHIGDFPDLRGHKRKSYLVVVYPTSEILGRVPLDKVEKTIFLTQKEAEAVFKERQEVSNEQSEDL